MSPLHFSPDVVAAICRHMNEDHVDDGLLICRALGGAPQATEATAIDVDGASIRFRVVEPGAEPRELAVPFGVPVHERSDVRRAVVELYERACVAAGVEPRLH